MLDTTQRTPSFAEKSTIRGEESVVTDLAAAISASSFGRSKPDQDVVCNSSPTLSAPDLHAINMSRLETSDQYLAIS